MGATSEIFHRQGRSLILAGAVVAHVGGAVAVVVISSSIAVFHYLFQ